MTLDEILKEIKKAEKIVILTHESTDGDAIGSSLAMKLMLKEIGKEADVILPEYSRLFDFLPGANEIKESSEISNYDLAISVDCANLKRLQERKYFENAKMKVNIDHHGTNTMFGNYNYVNPAAPACAQILLVVLEYFGIEITKDIGTCILTGIITDTGGFRYEGVTADTFEFVSWLLNKGVNVSKIYKKVLQTKTKANFELTKLATERIEFFEDGKVSFTYITKADENAVNAGQGDKEGIVEIGRDVEGVEVSVFVTESNKGIKCSLRSNEYVNVSDICLAFGGGGHIKAAGCTIQGCTIEQAKEKILRQIKTAL